MKLTGFELTRSQLEKMWARIRELRSGGLSTRATAKALGIDRSTVIRLERRDEKKAMPPDPPNAISGETVSLPPNTPQNLGNESVMDAMVASHEDWVRRREVERRAAQRVTAPEVEAPAEAHDWGQGDVERDGKVGLYGAELFGALMRYTGAPGENRVQVKALPVYGNWPSEHTQEPARPFGPQWHPFINRR